MQSTFSHADSPYLVIRSFVSRLSFRACTISGLALDSRPAGQVCSRLLFDAAVCVGWSSRRAVTLRSRGAALSTPPLLSVLPVFAAASTAGAPCAVLVARCCSVLAAVDVSSSSLLSLSAPLVSFVPVPALQSLAVLSRSRTAHAGWATSYFGASSLLLCTVNLVPSSLCYVRLPRPPERCSFLSPPPCPRSPTSALALPVPSHSHRPSYFLCRCTLAPAAHGCPGLLVAVPWPAPSSHRAPLLPFLPSLSPFPNSLFRFTGPTTLAPTHMLPVSVFPRSCYVLSLWLLCFPCFALVSRPVEPFSSCSPHRCPRSPTVATSRLVPLFSYLLVLSLSRCWLYLCCVLSS